MHGVLFQPQRGHLGQEPIGQPRLDEQLEPGRRVIPDEQLVELVTDPFRRHDLEAIAHRAHRLHHAGCRRDLKLGHEAGGPDHAQGVIGERDLGIERRVERAGRERLDAPVGIDESALGQPDGHRVDREIATRQVDEHVVAERHRGLAMLLRVDLLAVGRDLEALAVLERADGPERHPHQVAPIRPSLQHLRGLGGVGGRAEVQIDGRTAQDQVTNAPTDEVQLVTGVREARPELLGDRGHIDNGRLRIHVPRIVGRIRRSAAARREARTSDRRRTPTRGRAPRTAADRSRGGWWPYGAPRRS